MSATRSVRSQLSILLVEDDKDFRSQLLKLLGVFNEITEAGTLSEARAKLASGSYDVVLLDKTLPDGNGLDLISEIKRRNIATAVIVFTGDSNFNLVQKCLDSGANDYLIKSEHAVSDLLVRIPMALSRIALERQSRELSRQLKASFRHELVGHSPSVIEIRSKVESLKGSRSPVLILGESGTGKELVARRLNAVEEQDTRPFIAINCGALPQNLLESELFGHKRGSFTGATSDKAGAFVLANGGDLFLDEIGELPLESQVKLLRVLQEGEVTPIGSFKPIPISVRVIAATHRPIEELVREGKFRADLYYRINVFRLNTTPLKHRSEDIPELVQFILAEIGAPNFEITSGAVEHLKKQAWPGNIRELRNTIERSIFEAKRENTKTINKNHVQVIGSVSAHDGSSLRIPSSMDEVTPESFANFVSQMEKTYIQSVIQLCGGSMTSAAQNLGLNRATLYRKLGEASKNTVSTVGSASNAQPGLKTSDKQVQVEAANGL